MNKHELARFLRKQLRITKKKNKIAVFKRDKISASIKRISAVIDESEGLHEANEGYQTGEMRMKKQGTLDPDKASGIWIVTSRQERDVEMKKFKDVVQGINPIGELSMHLPSDKMIGPEDQKEVTFNPGDLIRCHFMGDMAEDVTKGGFAFHFANVGVANKVTELQYHYALGVLGLGEKTELPEGYQIVDGTFRGNVN
jgi:hypothetical protein